MKPSCRSGATAAAAIAVPPVTQLLQMCLVIMNKKGMFVGNNPPGTVVMNSYTGQPSCPGALFPGV